MIDWYGVLRNALWIMGLAVALAAFSYTEWRRHLPRPKQSLRHALGGAGFQAAFSLGMVLFCAGLALGSDRWWEIAAWAVLGALFAWQSFAAWRQLRRSTGPIQDATQTHEEDVKETTP
jgi:VanZ family protein